MFIFKPEILHEDWSFPLAPVSAIILGSITFRGFFSIFAGEGVYFVFMFELGQWNLHAIYLISFKAIYRLLSTL